MNIKKKLQFPTTWLNSSRCMFDICVAAIQRVIFGERLVKISHMFSPLPFSRCLFHSVCADPLMSVRQASYGHRRSLAFDCLFSGPDTGGSLREVKCKKEEEKKKRKTASWMFKGCTNPHSTDSQREIMQLVVSAWKSLHFIFLTEPPAAPTSQTGPAYQDLNGRQQRPLKNPQTWELANQGPNPSAWGQGEKAGFVFILPVSLSLSPILHNATGN